MDKFKNVFVWYGETYHQRHPIMPRPSGYSLKDFIFEPYLSPLLDYSDSVKYTIHYTEFGITCTFYTNENTLPFDFDDEKIHTQIIEHLQFKLDIGGLQFLSAW